MNDAEKWWFVMSIAWVRLFIILALCYINYKAFMKTIRFIGTLNSRDEKSHIFNHFVTLIVLGANIFYVSTIWLTFSVNAIIETTGTGNFVRSDCVTVDLSNVTTSTNAFDGIVNTNKFDQDHPTATVEDVDLPKNHGRFQYFTISNVSVVDKSVENDNEVELHAGNRVNTEEGAAENRFKYYTIRNESSKSRKRRNVEVYRDSVVEEISPRSWKALFDPEKYVSTHTVELSTNKSTLENSKPNITASPMRQEKQDIINQIEEDSSNNMKGSLKENVSLPLNGSKTSLDCRLVSYSNPYLNYWISTMCLIQISGGCFLFYYYYTMRPKFRSTRMMKHYLWSSYMASVVITFMLSVFYLIITAVFYKLRTYQAVYGLPQFVIYTIIFEMYASPNTYAILLGVKMAMYLIVLLILNARPTNLLPLKYRPTSNTDSSDSPWSYQLSSPAYNNVFWVIRDMLCWMPVILDMVVPCSPELKWDSCYSWGSHVVLDTCLVVAPLLCFQLTKEVVIDPVMDPAAVEALKNINKILYKIKVPLDSKTRSKHKNICADLTSVHSYA